MCSHYRSFIEYGFYSKLYEDIRTCRMYFRRMISLIRTLGDILEERQLILEPPSYIRSFINILEHFKFY